MIRILLTLVFVASAFSQSHLINFSGTRTDDPSRSYYISRVIDSRADQSSLGFARTGLFNIRKPIIVQGGLPLNINRYLGTYTNFGPEFSSIQLEITDLTLTEGFSGVGELASGSIKMLFSMIDTSQQIKAIFETAHTAEMYSNIDVTSSHSLNLVYLLDQGLDAFDQYYKLNEHNFMPTPGEPDSVALVPIIAPPPPVSNNLKKTMFTFGGMRGINGEGFRVAYYTYPESDEVWNHPVGFSATVLNVTNLDMRLEGRFINFGWSYASLSKLDDNGRGAVLAEFSIPIGNEVITDLYGNEETNFFIGVQLSESLLFVLDRESGLLFSVGLYQSLIPNSDLYPSDVGVKIQLGAFF